MSIENVTPALPTEMEAWQWTGTGRPLTRNVVEVPRPEADEVLVRVRAAGMCHSDVGVLDEPFWVEKIRLNPITIGHEIAGEVAAVGVDVDGVAVGDRVGICPSGRTAPGYGRHGGYAAYVISPAEDLVPMPDGLSFSLAAMGTDAGMTSHHAVVERAQVLPGDRVGVIGLGGLGQIGARIAALRGAQVFAADIRPEAVELGRELGLEQVFSSAEELVGLELDSVIDFAGFGSTTQAALGAIKRDGRVVMVGMAAPETTFRTADIINTKAQILGTSGGTVADIRAVYDYLAAGEVAPVFEKITFDEIPQGIDRLRAHEVTGRLVVEVG